MTATATLTDRYIDAAMRTVPEKQRPDLAAELRASIADQIDARVAAGESLGSAERAVLTDLGDPEKLAADYTDRPLWLIGPRYYLMWWRLTKLLWAIVPACAAFAVALAQVLAGAGIGETIGEVVPVALSVVVHIGFWTTLVFAVIERTTQGADAGIVPPWTLDRLPEKRQRGAGLSDLVASLVFLGFAVAVIIWDGVVGTVFLESAGGWVPFLAPSLWPWWIAGLFVLIALEGALAIRVYVQRRWTMASATVNALLNALIAVPALWLLWRGELLNPQFFPTFISGDSAETVSTIIALMLGFAFAGVAVWDTVDCYLKARRAR